MKKISGIYVIENMRSKNVYIGSSVSVYERWCIHKAQLRKGYHSNIHLQSAWNKYGESAFNFRILLICCPEQVVFYEQRAIDKFDSYKNGYNRRPKAENCLGIKASDETKRKMSAARKGVSKTLRWRKMMSKRMKGNTFGLNKKMPQAWIEKLIARNNGNKNMLGKKMPVSFSQAQSLRNKGNKFGRFNKGRIFSAETLAKMSLAQKSRWRKRKQESLISA